MAGAVKVSLDWIKSIIHILKTTKYNIEGVEIETFDLGKATILLNSISNIQSVVQSLEKIKNDPEKYSYSN
jgi:hypothetical protein